MHHLPLPRLSLNHGSVITGFVGSRFRQSMALIGPALPIASRILKHAPPGCIIATEALVQAAQDGQSKLAHRFELSDQALLLEGIEESRITVYLASPESGQPT